MRVDGYTGLENVFESDCNPAPLSDVQEQTPDDMSDEQSEGEYHAIKGGSEAET